MDSITSIVLVLFISAFLYFKWKSNYWKRRGVNGPKSYPLIGTLWENLLLPSNLLELKRYKKYGKVYGTMQGWKPVLVIADPELIKLIRITDFKYFMNNRTLFPGDPLLSNMLNELNGSEWKRVRSIINPVFSTGKIIAMQPLIEKCVNNALQYFEMISKNEKEVDLKKCMLCYTLDTISACAFALETDGYKNPNNEFLRKITDISNFRVWRLISSLLLPPKLQISMNLQLYPQKSMNYLENVLKVTIEQRSEKNILNNDFLQQLLNAKLSKEDQLSSIKDARKTLSDNEIIANCILFFMGGLETTASILHYALYNLAMNSDIQDKLYNEIRNLYDLKKKFEYEDVMSLPYLNAIINESLRIYPSIILFEHVCNEDYKLGETGITVDKGTIVTTPFYALHHDAEYFPEPEKFKPERFLPENESQIQPYTFIPFGVGPRMCIANRFAQFTIKFFLVNLISQFEVIKTKNTPDTPKYNGSFVFLSCEPILVKLRKREEADSDTNSMIG